MLTVCAKTSKERGMKHIALFLVDRGSPGVTLGKKIDKLGVRASATGEILLDGVFVPDGHLLGGETGGVEKVGTILSEIRIMTGALSVGLGRAAYEAALRYSKERVTFGKPIGEHQAIAFKLADMLTQLHAATLLVYHAAWAVDQGLPVTREAAMTKLFASEAANRISYKAVQIFGGYGYIKESRVERFYRDARVTTLYEGTSEIQRLVISRQLIEGGEDGDRA
jgi:alkylation response protein AidB-like acyl-CoA dehydrogenase